MAHFLIGLTSRSLGGFAGKLAYFFAKRKGNKAVNVSNMLANEKMILALMAAGHAGMLPEFEKVRDVFIRVVDEMKAIKKRPGSSEWDYTRVHYKEGVPEKEYIDAFTYVMGNMGETRVLEQTKKRESCKSVLRIYKKLLQTQHAKDLTDKGARDILNDQAIQDDHFEVNTTLFALEEEIDSAEDQDDSDDNIQISDDESEIHSDDRQL